MVSFCFSFSGEFWPIHRYEVMIRFRRNERTQRRTKIGRRSDNFWRCLSFTDSQSANLLQRETESFLVFFDNQEKELFLIDNTNTNTDTNTKRPLMKEQIVDCGEETQQTDVEIESSQKNIKEKY